jgi:DnaJ domain
MGTLGRKPVMLLVGPAVGVAGAIALPAAGIGMGIKRTGQGFINTPSTIKRAIQGKEVLDEPTEDEVFDAAQEFLAGQVSGVLPAADGDAAAVDASSSSVSSSLPPPVDTTLYEVLELSADATPSQIKRAYYQQARLWHPDRNSTDEATERFQKVGEAYQVLSDPERRLLYHKRGRDSVDQTDLMGADLLFNLMFGNGKFAHMVGELLVQRTATTAEQPSAAVSKAQQEYRVAELTAKLVARLEPWTSASDEGMASVLADAEKEVRLLRKSPFGVDLFHVRGDGGVVRARVCVCVCMFGLTCFPRGLLLCVGTTVHWLHLREQGRGAAEENHCGDSGGSILLDTL